MRYMRFTKKLFKDKYLFKVSGPPLEKALNWVRRKTATEIIDKIFSYIGGQQQFCIVDDGHKTLIDCDKLFEFVGNLAKQYGVEVEE